MQNRNPITVALLTLVTLGFYSLYWNVVTKREMVKLGADIPTSWLMIVPLVNYWWFWKYSMGVEKVTNGKLSGVLTFVLLILLGFIGMAIVQDSFNNVSAPSANPAAAAPADPTA